MPFIRLRRCARYRYGQYHRSKLSTSLPCLAFLFSFSLFHHLCRCRLIYIIFKYHLDIWTELFSYSSLLLFFVCRLRFFDFSFPMILLSYLTLSLQLPLIRTSTSLLLYHPVSFYLIPNNAMQFFWSWLFHLYFPLLCRCYQEDISVLFPLRGQHRSWVGTRMTHIRHSSFRLVSGLLDWCMHGSGHQLLSQ